MAVIYSGLTASTLTAHGHPIIEGVVRGQILLASSNNSSLRESKDGQDKKFKAKLMEK